jgi:hypothetical protein
VRALPNAAAMVQPIGNGGTGSPERSHQELYKKNFHHMNARSVVLRDIGWMSRAENGKDTEFLGYSLRIR